MLRYFCNCIPKTPKTTRQEKYLETVAYHDTIPFIPPITSGKVIKVYDGDTVTIASKLPYDNSPIYRFSIRLLGIDSPEMDRRIFQMGRPQGVYMNFRGQYMKIRNVSHFKPSNV
jgi:endonuclease YncB( thermonuclease family)